MSNEIVRYESSGITQVDIASELPAIFTLAKALTKAPGFIPQHLKNEGEIAAVILAGRELGLQPMVSLRSLSMIKGKVVLAADVMLGLMIRAGAKVKWISDGANGVAKLELTRPGQEPHVSTFTMEDAQKAGLASNDNYKKHQGAMLRARAVSSAARAYMPDILSGSYVPGELEEEPATSRAGKAKRTLDDVASVPRESQAIAAGMSDAAIDAARHEDESGTGAVTYTTAMHANALQSCDVDALQGWYATLADLGLTQDEKRNAWAMFRQRCLELGVDAKSYTGNAS